MTILIVWRSKRRGPLKLNTFSFTAGLLLLLSIDAKAQPALSGSYAYSLNRECQVNLKQIQSQCSNNCGADIQDIKTNNTGRFYHAIATATFTGTQMTLNGKAGKGAVLFYNPKSGAGDFFSAVTLSGTVSYSNTDTTFTFAGNKYNAVYGNIVNGAADYVTFERIDTVNECVEYGTLVHQ
jgi:hypothetical protein